MEGTHWGWEREGQESLDDGKEGWRRKERDSTEFQSPKSQSSIRHCKHQAGVTWNLIKRKQMCVSPEVLKQFGKAEHCLGITRLLKSFVKMLVW